MKREDIWGDPPGMVPEVIKAGNLLFLALGGYGYTMEEGAEQAFKRLDERLKKAGSSCENIVQMSFYYVNREDIAKDIEAMKKVRARYIPPNKMPASVGIGVSRVYKADPPLQLELQVIAIVPDG